MRFWVVIGSIVSLAAAAAPLTAAPRPICNLEAPDAAHAGAGCARAWLNANMRINQLQLVGTAESYKQAPSAQMLSLIAMGGKKDAEALNFSEPPIAAQLDAGARSLSFDVAYDPKGGLFRKPAGASMADDLLDPDYVAAMSKPGFKVIHVLDVDYRSSCANLHDCLGQVAAWSRAHKGHMPIVIALRTNDTKTPMPGATKPQPYDAAAFDALDGEIRAVFKPGEMITPDQVKGTHATLREAVTAGGWPTLGQARDKVIFVLDDCAQKVGLYGGAAHDLSGKPMFVTADEASPMASFIAIDDPVKEAGRILADVKQGFIVRTRADDSAIEARSNDIKRRDQAFASGAQIIQTDFLLPDKGIGAYQVNISDSRHAQCNALLSTDGCANWNAAGAQTAAR